MRGRECLRSFFTVFAALAFGVLSSCSQLTSLHFTRKHTNGKMHYIANLIIL